MDTLADRLSKLPYNTPNAATSSLLQLHEQLSLALRQAQQAANAAAQCASQNEKEALLVAQFIKITATKRAEAVWYLQQTCYDIQTAIICWHNQVLRDCVKAYQQVSSCLACQRSETAQAVH